MPDDDLDWLYRPPLSPTEHLRYFAPVLPVASSVLTPREYDAAAHRARVASMRAAYPYCTADACEAHALALTKRIVSEAGWTTLDVAANIGEAILALLKDEGIYQPPLPSLFPDSSYDYRTLVLRPQLLDAEAFYADWQRIVAIAEERLFELFVTFLRLLPRIAEREAATVPVIDLVRNPYQFLTGVTGFLRRDDTPTLFARLHSRFTDNVLEVSGLTREQVVNAPGRIRLPTHMTDRSPSELVPRFFSGTPFVDLFLTPVPLTIPAQIRFEHHWIVAGTGHGKTQTLQHLIADDLDRVIKGEASAIVIDSQGEMIDKISRLQLFADHPEKLCLIDPADIAYPVALNLFDIGTARLAGYGSLEREKLQNAAIEMYEYILAALLGADMTAKQSTLFRYVLRVMLNIENATIHTFRELMEGSGKYRDAIERLPFTARTFMETEFNSREHEQTKRQVVRRLWGILENQSFERMFSHPRSKFDMFAEMNAGKVILISTAKDLLKQEAAAIFGRFFIALIAQAAQERAAVPAARLPCFVYIDECADYLDQNVGVILAQARKFNVGMILAHQYIGQLPPRLQEGFDANTSIKFVGGVSSTDARAFARMLRCEPEFIESQRKGQFAVFVRNLTDRAISLRIPFGRLEDMPRVSDNEWQRVRDSVRARYAARPDMPRPAATGPDAPTPAAPEGDDWRS